MSDAQPIPLPATIPAGVYFSTGVPQAFGETTGTLTLRDGVYRGPTRLTFTTGAEPVETADRYVRPADIDWRSLRAVTDA